LLLLLLSLNIQGLPPGPPVAAAMQRWCWVMACGCMVAWTAGVNTWTTCGGWTCSLGSGNIMQDRWGSFETSMTLAWGCSWLLNTM
jgi:hypothetical protein